MKTKPPSQGELIAKAAAMYAAGSKIREITRELKQPANFVYRVQEQHPELWAAALEGAMEQALAQVRAAAGTDAVLADPAAHIAKAAQVEKWARKRKRAVFHQPAPAVTQTDGARHTLTTFFERYYLPVCMSEASPLSVNLYRIVLRKWALLTGDPPLSDISNEMLARYREALIAMPNRSRPGKLSAFTIRTQMRHVQILLDKAGPPGKRNRDAAGFIPVSPWAKMPKGELPEPRIVDGKLLGDCYNAAAEMETPRISKAFKPSAWWRALLVVTLNLGLRSRTLFAMRFDWIDWQAKLLRIPAKALKSRKSLVLPLNTMVLAHLKAIRTPRELVFELPYSLEMFHRYFKKLQRLAGIPQSKFFGLHNIRKTCASILWATNPAAAQLMLGHSSMLITQQHYVASRDVLQTASDAFPQPAAFGGST